MASALPLASRFDFEDLSRRFLTKRNITRASNGIRHALLGTLFLLMTYTVWFTVDQSLSSSPEIDKILLTAQRGSVGSTESFNDSSTRLSLSRKDTRIIRNTKLFGFSKTASETKTDAPEEVSAEPLNITLIGTFVSSGDSSVAIIEDKKLKTQEVFSVGEKVFEQGDLLAIKEHSIDIRYNGQIETLVIDDSSPSSSGGPVPADAEEIQVESTELDGALDNLPLLLTQARAVPYFKQGKSVGLRLFAIKTGSLYEKIGLKNGDILKTINGNNLGDFSQAMKLFEQLREERSLTLKLERNREDKTYHYSIK